MYPSQNINGRVVEVWWWITSFIPHFAYVHAGLKLFRISKKDPENYAYGY